MLVYRIEREKYLSTTLSGLGASLSAGFRWNSEHTRMVYTAESRALALLEVAVHLDLSEDLPKDRYIVEIEIPDKLKVQELTAADLPRQWNHHPPLRSTKDLGDQFINSHTSAVMKVPSALVPMEYNYLINPLHPDSTKIRVKRKTKLTFDSRLKFGG
ncbi:MAG: hypothetical protein RL220_1755 [Bacteroidota bacterium]